MRVNIVKSKNAEQVYILKSYRKEDGKSTSKIFKKLGTMQSLLSKHDNDRNKVIAWANEQANIFTEQEKLGQLKVPVEFSPSKQIEFGKKNSFSAGYLFLQKIYRELNLDTICSEISAKYDFKYNLSEILSSLIFARILLPASKLSSYEYIQNMLKKPTFALHDIYRCLDVLDKESDYIQANIYENTKNQRNTSVLYYDCTNFFFEIEEEKGIKKYGKSKEHRPNPIVQMGLFLDGNGVPLTFTIFSGNENEQPTLIPLEKKILNDFSLSKFIVCTDAGLASNVNRKFNNHANRSFVVTQSLKQIKDHLRTWALDPKGWKIGKDSKTYDISNIEEVKYKNIVFHKERWIHENGLEQRLIVSYSIKYKHYQKEIRERQINRAIKIIEQGQKYKTTNPNSPTRFIEEQNVTTDGEIAQTTLSSLNQNKILEESKYDGFTALCTTLEDDVYEIIKINNRRWEIEESFRIMKSEFKSRPVYLQNDPRIRAHFLTCFLSLLVYRMLEHKLGEKYSVSQIMKTLRNMNLLKIESIGYIPEYTRNEITDILHNIMGFRTDTEIILEKDMKKMLKDRKSEKNTTK